MTINEAIERSSKWEQELIERFKKETSAYEKAKLEGMIYALHTQRYDLYTLGLERR